VLQLLAKEGLVEARRGIRGGFCLSRPAEQITILEAVNAVDPIRRIQVCPLGLKAHGRRLCPLHKKLDTALEQMEQAFASTSLADVLSEPSQSVPLCVFPQLART
jgi:Rrf2 family protein